MAHKKNTNSLPRLPDLLQSLLQPDEIRRKVLFKEEIKKLQTYNMIHDNYNKPYVFGLNEESKGKYKHLLYVPFVGLGLYGGYRGARWLRSRIQIFKQFVIPSLQAQTCKDFTLWISWRPEERHNYIVKDFQRYLKTVRDRKSV